MKKFTAYLHSSKETMWDKGEDLGLSEESLRQFSYALSEVKLDCSVDEETGFCEIERVDGKIAISTEELDMVHPNFDSIFAGIVLTLQEKGKSDEEIEKAVGLLQLLRDSMVTTIKNSREQSDKYREQLEGFITKSNGLSAWVRGDIKEPIADPKLKEGIEDLYKYQCEVEQTWIPF